MGDFTHENFCWLCSQMSLRYHPHLRRESWHHTVECIAMRLSRVLAVVCLSAVAGMATSTFATQMVYTGFVTTDVQLGRQKWHDADVTFRFVGIRRTSSISTSRPTRFLRVVEPMINFAGLWMVSRP